MAWDEGHARLDTRHSTNFKPKIPTEGQEASCPSNLTYIAEEARLYAHSPAVSFIACLLVVGIMMAIFQPVATIPVYRDPSPVSP